VQAARHSALSAARAEVISLFASFPLPPLRPLNVFLFFFFLPWGHSQNSLSLRSFFASLGPPRTQGVQSLSFLSFFCLTILFFPLPFCKMPPEVTKNPVSPIHCNGLDSDGDVFFFFFRFSFPRVFLLFLPPPFSAKRGENPPFPSPRENPPPNPPTLFFFLPFEKMKQGEPFSPIQITDPCRSLSFFPFSSVLPLYLDE